LQLLLLFVFVSVNLIANYWFSFQSVHLSFPSDFLMDPDLYHICACICRKFIVSQCSIFPIQYMLTANSKTKYHSIRVGFLIADGSFGGYWCLGRVFLWPWSWILYL